MIANRHLINGGCVIMSGGYNWASGKITFPFLRKSIFPLFCLKAQDCKRITYPNGTILAPLQ